MTLGATLGVIVALGAVLGLMMVALRVLKHFMPRAAGGGRGRVPLEVMQRVALGPKQAIAVVRVGERMLAVSIGEGGIRPLMELAESDREQLLAASAASTPVAFASSAQAALGFARRLPAAAGLPGGDWLTRLAARPTARVAADAVMADADAFGPPPPAIDRSAATGVSATSVAATSVAATTVAATTVAATTVAATDAADRVEFDVESAPVIADERVWGPPPDHNIVRGPSAAVIARTPYGADPRTGAPRGRSDLTDFRAVLGMALSSSTRLASIGLVAIGALSVEARAQTLPTTPPAAQTQPQQPPPQQQQPPAAPAVTAPQVTLPAVAQPQIAQPQIAPPQAAQPAAVQPQLAPPAVTPAARPNARRAASPSLAQRRAQALAATQAAQARAAQPPAAGQTAPAATQAAPVTTSASVDTMIARLAPQMDLRVGEGAGGLRLSGTVGVVVMMGLLTLLPTLVLMMTGFTRILIVLHFLKQALGTQSAPPAHLVGGLALLLTGFVMGPTLGEVNRTALQPWMNGQIEQAEMMSVGVRPFREFMLKQTRERDIEVFIEMSRMEAPATVDDVPLVVLVSAFVTSELRTAFQIGFALFLPFIIIDIVVSSVLMSMGMMMLPPAMIALPFKLLLFVLVDGWTLVIQSLVQSFK